MLNTGILAVIVYILISIILLLLPKKSLNKRLKKDMDITEADLAKGNALGYYKMLFGISALITIIIMLIYKFVIAS